MSRWSADILRIALTPGEVALARGAQQIALADAGGLPRLLGLLDETLNDPAWHTTRAEVVLSQRLVRHVLTEPPHKLLSTAEEHALVKASLRRIYGEQADGWAVQVVSQPPHAGLMGAALDADVLDSLQTLLRRRGCRQIAIRPLTSVAARHVPARLDGWWLLAEPGWLGLFGAVRGVWQHVAGVPIDGLTHAALPQFLARERASAPDTLGQTAWLHALGLGSVTAPQDASLRWQVLPHDGRLAGAAALLGV